MKTLWYPSFANWHYFLLLSLLVCFSCKNQQPGKQPRVLTGLDRVAQGKNDLFQSKRVGVITNQTGVTFDGRHIADVFHDDPQIDLVALYGPEHGIRGQVEGGQKVASNLDEKTGTPIFSLYGKTRKPTPEMLKGVDMLVFDIQDVGTRFYTYISTMSLAMEAAAEKGIPFVVLDRPNPIGGEVIEGPVLDAKFRSFVGIHPIPLRHGMTIGELARMFNGERWLKNGIRVDLQVISMQGWKRNMLFRDTGLAWIPPSPNMPSPNTALLYPGMGLLEATNFSEGRGTDHPFEIVGAPWSDSKTLIQALRAVNLAGLAFEPVEFRPKDMPGKVTNPKFEGELCNGIRFRIKNGQKIRAVQLGIQLLTILQKNYPDNFRMYQRRMSLMTGQEWVYDAILSGESAESIQSRWQKELQAFENLRRKYLLYL